MNRENAGAPPELLRLSDLSPVVETVAQALMGENQVMSIASLSGLGDAPLPSGNAQSRDRWTPVFGAALEASPETLPLLLKNIRRGLAERPKGNLERALRDVRISCVSRVTRTAHPELNDQVDELMSASIVPEMTDAAANLRRTALSVRRLLMRPLLADMFLELEREMEITCPDPEWLRMQLADQAVNVVTATDYLLTLLLTPAITSSQLVLGGEPGSERAQGRTDEETIDWMTRRRLDARGTAVREGMRLLVALRRDVAFG